MTWRGWDQYLADTTQTGADAITRTDNGDGQPVTEEIGTAWKAYMAVLDPDGEYT